MGSWSVDSLPSVAGFCNEELQELLVHSWSNEDLKRLLPKLVCILTQPELKSSSLRKLGFRTVKSSAHHSTDFFRHQECPAHIKALMVTHVGYSVDKKVLDCVRALADNESVPTVIVVLIMPSECPSHSSALSMLSETKLMDSVLRQTTEQCFMAGADDVISLQNEAQLLSSRIAEAIIRAEVNARKVFHVEKAIEDIKTNTRKHAKLVEAQASRKLQAAWNDHIWSLPGQTFSRIPVEDLSLEERPGTPGGNLGGVQNYEFLSKLGRGSFGTVLKGQLVPKSPDDKPTKGPYFAIKVIKKGSVKSAGALFSLDQEFGIMMNLNPHPNIARALQVLHGREYIYLIMEFAGTVNLHSFVQQSLSSSGANCLPKTLVRPFLENMTAAVAHVHSALICHRDLKPSNMVVSDGGKLSLVDFGLAAVLCGKDDVLTQCCGSRPYCAPEVLAQQFKGAGYKPFPVDVWSLAVNFIEIGLGPYSVEKLLGWVPEHPTDDRRLLADVQRLEKIWASSAPDTGVEGLNVVISRMLMLDPEARLTMDMVRRGETGLGLHVPSKPNGPPPPRGPGGRGAPRPSRNKQLVVAGGGAAVQEQATGQHVPRPLMERLKGNSHVIAAIEAMLDEAIVQTPIGFVLDSDPASIPTLRALYSEGVVSYLSCSGPDQGVAVLATLRDRHKAWCFSDADFDSLASFFGAELARRGIATSTVQEACGRFAELRPAVTYSYQANLKAASEHRRTRQGARAPHSGGEVPARVLEKGRRLGVELSGILGSRDDFQTGLAGAFPEDFSQWATFVEHRAVNFFNGATTEVPIPMRDSILNLDDAAELIDFVRSVMSESNVYSEMDVNDVYFAMREEWDLLRLDKRLQALHNLTAGVDTCSDESCWVSLCLQWQLAVEHRKNKDCGGPCPAYPQCLPEFLAFVGSVMQRAVQGGAKLAADTVSGTVTDWRQLGMRHKVFDMLEETLPTACSELPPTLVPQVDAVFRSLRPFVLVGVEE